MKRFVMLYVPCGIHFDSHVLKKNHEENCRQCKKIKEEQKNPKKKGIIEYF